ncbi:MAG TPA: hypothetical protein VMX38_01495 [Verrucomicrobiae bacterium]|nr:hypothetical protein [Verrucomicrobiae bacterium]
MSGKIDPEAMEPATTQAFDLSDRNPAVEEWGEGGGAIESPAADAGRATPEGKAISPDEGLKY